MGERLHFRKVEGEGPETGWVSIRPAESWRKPWGFRPLRALGFRVQGLQVLGFQDLFSLGAAAKALEFVDYRVRAL